MSEKEKQIIETFSNVKAFRKGQKLFIRLGRGHGDQGSRRGKERKGDSIEEDADCK